MKSWILVFALLVSVVHAAAPQPSAPPTIPVTVTKGADGALTISPITADDQNAARALATQAVDAQIANTVKARVQALVKAGGASSPDVEAAFKIELSADRQRRIDYATGAIVQRSIDAAVAKAK